MQAVHVPCPSCGLGLPIAGVAKLSCSACGEVTRLRDALRSELGASRERLDGLAHSEAESRVREHFVRSHRLGWRHALLLLGPFVGTGITVGAEMVIPGLYGWVCAAVAVPYLVWAVLWMRKSAAEMRSHGKVEALEPTRLRRCITCGAPTPVGVVAGEPCASCDTPLLASETDRVEALDHEAERVAAVAARVASLERQLQARIDRHRYVDYAPWTAFALCFGYIPPVGLVAGTAGFAAGNYDASEYVGLLTACAGVAIALSIWPVWRRLRVRRFEGELEALENRGLRARRDPAPLLDWLDAHWSIGAPTLPRGLFCQGRRWATVVFEDRALVLNLDAVYRQHPCQPAAWLLVRGAHARPEGLWSGAEQDGRAVYSMSADAVRALRRRDWAASARRWIGERAPTS